MIPIGRGQRELIIGDRSTGKTTIASTRSSARRASTRRPKRPATRPTGRSTRIYVAIGQKQSTVARIISVLEEAGRDAVHDHPGRGGIRLRDQPVPRALCRRRHGRVVHGQRHGRADRLRRSVQARGRLSPGVAGAEAAVGPRSLSGRRVLPAQPPARARRARRRAVRRRLADGAADHRDAGRRRVGLHPDQRHLDHRRPDLPRDRPVLPGRAAGDLGRHLGIARRLRGAAQGDEAGRRAAEGRSGAVPRAGGVRAVRLGARRDDAGQDRSRQAHRRAVQAAPVQPGRRSTSRSA